MLSFGSNQYGQLGAGDIVPHHKLVKVKVPKASIIAAGSYHSVVMTREGEIYTFGNSQVWLYNIRNGLTKTQNNEMAAHWNG